MNDFIIRYEAEGTRKYSGGGNDCFDVLTEEENGLNKIIVRAKKTFKLLSFEQCFAFVPEKRDLYFMNGYQSWTDTKEFTLKESERNVNKLPRSLVNAFAFDRYGDATFYAYGKKRLHGYDVFYCKGKREKFILNLNYANAYLLIELDKSKKILNLSHDFNLFEVGEGCEFTVAEYYLSDSVKAGMEYFNEVFPKRNTRKIFGYTSWYNYYQNINQEIILRDLGAADEKFNLFQIDDGYQTKVGDWLEVDKNKFPDGLSPVVDAIHKKGLKAGLWLAPFVAESESKLFTEHKELFKKYDNGEYVKCGANWSGFYALDLENAEARAYIKKCLCHYADMGFDLFKLDFLYAANLAPVNGKSRSMAAESAYSFLRECLGDKLILGCGATVFNCIDKFDYLRVGPDVSLIFDDVWFMRFMHRERISTKITLQNTVYRSFFNDRLFGNDPDVFLLRDDNIKLSLKQRRAMITINALFGSVLMTSDNLNGYDENKRKLLEDSLKLFYGAEVKNYSRSGKMIMIEYEMNGNAQKIKYDTEKGAFYD